jgi:hypothetical protein
MSKEIQVKRIKKEFEMLTQLKDGIQVETL